MIENKHFIEIYMKSVDIKQAADELGISVPTVYNKLRYLKDLGIDMPRKKRNSKSDIQELKELVEKLKKQYGDLNGR